MILKEKQEFPDMIPFERFEEITYELAQQLPEEFFRKLDGGVMAREAAARGEVWLAQIGDIRFPQDFYMVVHRDKYLTGAALRFMELVRRSAASFLYGGRGN